MIAKQVTQPILEELKPSRRRRPTSKVIAVVVGCLVGAAALAVLIVVIVRLAGKGGPAVRSPGSPAPSGSERSAPPVEAQAAAATAATTPTTPAVGTGETAPATAASTPSVSGAFVPKESPSFSASKDGAGAGRPSVSASKAMEFEACPREIAASHENNAGPMSLDEYRSFMEFSRLSLIQVFPLLLKSAGVPEDACPQAAKAIQPAIEAAFAETLERRVGNAGSHNQVTEQNLSDDMIALAEIFRARRAEAVKTAGPQNIAKSQLVLGLRLAEYIIRECLAKTPKPGMPTMPGISCETWAKLEYLALSGRYPRLIDKLVEIIVSAAEVVAKNNGTNVRPEFNGAMAIDLRKILNNFFVSDPRNGARVAKSLAIGLTESAKWVTSDLMRGAPNPLPRGHDKWFYVGVIHVCRLLAEKFNALAHEISGEQPDREPEAAAVVGGFGNVIDQAAAQLSQSK